MPRYAPFRPGGSGRECADVRATELADKGIEPEDVVGATLAMNGTDWKIISHQPIPVPTDGESKGEIRLTFSDGGGR